MKYCVAKENNELETYRLISSNIYKLLRGIQNATKNYK